MSTWNCVDFTKEQQPTRPAVWGFLFGWGSFPEESKPPDCGGLFRAISANDAEDFFNLLGGDPDGFQALASAAIRTNHRLIVIPRKCWNTVIFFAAKRADPHMILIDLHGVSPPSRSHPVPDAGAADRSQNDGNPQRRFAHSRSVECQNFAPRA